MYSQNRSSIAILSLCFGLQLFLATDQRSRREINWELPGVRWPLHSFRFTCDPSEPTHTCSDVAVICTATLSVDAEVVCHIWGFWRINSNSELSHYFIAMFFALSFPPLSLPVSYSGLHNQNWIRHPAFSMLVYLKMQSVIIIMKYDFRQAGLSTFSFLPKNMVVEDGSLTQSKTLAIYIFLTLYITVLRVRKANNFYGTAIK